MNNNLKIKTATIQIKVLMVDNHKMTKATFRQIQREWDSKINAKQIMGWVYDRSYCYLLFNIKGKIFKRLIDGFSSTFGCTPQVCNLNGEMLSPEDNAECIEYIKNSFDQLFIAT